MDEAPSEPDRASDALSDAAAVESLPAEIVVAQLVDERPLPVWTVFAVYLGTFFVCALAQIPVLVALAVYHMAVHGQPPAASDLMMSTPLRFVALMLPAQLAILGVWWLASRFGDRRGRSFRPIGGTSLGVGAYCCFLPATLVVMLLGGPLAEWGMRVFGEWQADVTAQLYQDMDWFRGIVFVVVIAVVPAIVEELFFRGYMQRRLLARCHPAAAISVVAVLFAAFHGTPALALGVLPLGLWFGILAWRTGSLWPGIWCHGFVNGSINLWRVGAAVEAWPGQPAQRAYVAGLAICVSCLVVSIWILIRYRRQDGPQTIAGAVAG